MFHLFQAVVVTGIAAVLWCFIGGLFVCLAEGDGDDA